MTSFNRVKGNRFAAAEPRLKAIFLEERRVKVFDSVGRELFVDQVAHHHQQILTILCGAALRKNELQLAEALVRLGRRRLNPGGGARRGLLEGREDQLERNLRALQLLGGKTILYEETIVADGDTACTIVKFVKIAISPGRLEDTGDGSGLPIGESDGGLLCHSELSRSFVLPDGKTAVAVVGLRKLALSASFRKPA